MNWSNSLIIPCLKCNKPDIATNACCCPCISTGNIMTFIKEDYWSWYMCVLCCCCIGIACARKKYRHFYNIEGNIYRDIILSSCCYSCVIYQMYQLQQQEDQPIISTMRMY